MQFFSFEMVVINGNLFALVFHGNVFCILFILSHFVLLVWEIDFMMWRTVKE